MDEFTKTKIGFTVGLLAVVIALKPLIDATEGIGFEFLGFLLTIKSAFNAMTLLMGFALYVMAFQFLHIGKWSIFDRISRSAYAFSLITPVAYAVLWVISLLVASLAPLFAHIPSGISGGFVGAASAVILNKIAKPVREALRLRDDDSRKEDSRKKELEVLVRAEVLIKDGHYDLSVLESFKLIEMSLRQLIDKDRLSLRKNDMRSLLKSAAKMMIFSPDELTRIDEIRLLRNRVSHENFIVPRDLAENAFEIAKSALVRLSNAETIASYNWLELNRTSALNILMSPNDSKCQLVIKYLWDAWQRRDGIIWLELSTFFEAALQYNLHPLIEVFAANPKQFEEWLSQIQNQIFTNWTGDEKERLQSVKANIMTALDAYLVEPNVMLHRDVALKIYAQIKDIDIREIE